MAASKDLPIIQGKTFSSVVRWELEDLIIYAPITAIQQTAPVRMTVPGNPFPDGWRCAVTNVKGPTEINAEANNVKDKDYNPITVIDANTVEINKINAAGFKPYVSGGILQGNTPVDLTGFTARMDIKDKVGGTVLHSLTATGIALNTTLHTITLTISAADTEAFTWKKGVYDLELVSASGVVTALLTGAVSVTKEVTT